MRAPSESRLLGLRLATAAAAALACAFASPGTAAAAGELDPSFGTGGFTILAEPDGVNESLFDAELLADGNILAAGRAGTANGFLLARFTPAGAPDAAFGSGGIQVQPDTGLPGAPRSLDGITFDAQGRLIAAGLARGPSANAVGFARYALPGGTPDGTFSGDGVASIFCGSTPCSASDVAPAANGDVVAVGRFGSDQSNAAFRVDSAGAPSGFGGDGIVVFDGPAQGDALAVEALANGTFLVGGALDDAAYVGLLGDGGVPVTGFGEGGFATLDFQAGPGNEGVVEDLEVLPDGRIVAVGTSYSTGADGTDAAIARLLPTGEPDPTFGSGGVVTRDFAEGFSDEEFEAVMADAGGRVTAVGSTGTLSEESADVIAMRVTPAGQPDPSFGSGGVARVNVLPTLPDAAFGGIPGAEGETIFVGSASPGTSAELLIGRLTGDPPCLGSVPTIAAGPAGGALPGTPGPDVIAGGPGPDQIQSGDGDDVVCGGGGDDTLLASAGADQLAGEDGKDTAKGGAGDDGISGGASADRLGGGSGKDTLRGDAGKDRLKGGGGKDKLKGGGGKDKLAGGGGRDRCNGGPGRDRERGC